MHRAPNLILACGLCLSPVFACGGDGEDSGTTSNDTTATASDTSGSAGDTTADTTADGTDTADTTDTTTDDGSTSGADAGTDTGGSGHAGSCDFRPGELQCWHAVNEFDEPAAIMDACAMSGGTYSAGDCDTTDLVAICDQTPFKIFHYYDGVDLGLTEIVCMQIGGIWMPQ